MIRDGLEDSGSSSCSINIEEWDCLYNRIPAMEIFYHFFNDFLISLLEINCKEELLIGTAAIRGKECMAAL